MVRGRLRTQERRATIFSATKTTGNVMTVILPACLIRKSGRPLQAREQKLRDAIARDPKLRSTIAAYDRIKRAQAEIAKNAPLYNYLEQERPSPVGYRGPRALFGNLFKYARLLVRALDERAKPNGERIPQFRDSARDSLELELFRPN